MRSDYEILIARELKKGKRNPKEIAKSVELPEVLVEVVLKKMNEGIEAEIEEEKRFLFTRESLKLLVDVLIIYLLIAITLQVIPWF